MAGTDIEQRASAASHFGSVTETRKHLRSVLGARCSVLDNAQAGRVTTVQREAARFAVVDAEQLLRS